MSMRDGNILESTAWKFSGGEGARRGGVFSVERGQEVGAQRGRDDVPVRRNRPRRRASRDTEARASRVSTPGAQSSARSVKSRLTDLGVSWRQTFSLQPRSREPVGQGSEDCSVHLIKFGSAALTYRLQ